MNAYISGTLSTPQDNFHLTDLWLSNDNAEDTDIPSLDRIGLSGPDGFDCETVVSEDGLAFYFRWKGVWLNDVDEEGIEYSTELFGVGQLKLMIENRNMSLRNASAFVDGECKLNITEVKLVDKEEEWVIDQWY